MPQQPQQEQAGYSHEEEHAEVVDEEVLAAPEEVAAGCAPAAGAPGDELAVQAAAQRGEAPAGSSAAAGVGAGHHQPSAPDAAPQRR